MKGQKKVWLVLLLQVGAGDYCLYPAKGINDLAHSFLKAAIAAAH